jgi:hypothetical protein
MTKLCAALSRPFGARTYNGGMNNGIEISPLGEGHGTTGPRSMPHRPSSAQATGEPRPMPPEEVNTMAKKDEGRRDIKKDKERDR